MAGIALTMSACSSVQKDEQLTCDKSDIKIEAGVMTPEALWAMGRMAEPQVSPDGTRIAYEVSYPNVEADKSNSELYVVGVTGEGNTRLTHTNVSEHQPNWFDDHQIAFMASTEDEGMQLFMMKDDGADRRQVSHVEGGIQGFMFSPDRKYVLYVKNIKVEPSNQGKDMYADLPKTSGRVIRDLNYRHWDQWVDEIPHPFLAAFDGASLGETTDLLEGEMYECPMLPWGGVEQLAFTPDSKQIAYTCRKKTGMDYAVSTNSDIYLYDIATKQTRNLTEGMMGYDTNPAFSPDGHWMAWGSMERDGYESDKNRLFLMDMQSGAKKDLFEQFDQSVDMLTWGADSRTIWFTSVQHGTIQIYKADIQSGDISRLTDGVHDYAWVAECKDGLVGMRHSMSVPNDLYAIDAQTGEQKQITQENKHILDQLEPAQVEARWMPTTDGKQMLTWIIYPPHFDSSKKYPTLLYCEGGPQSPVSQFWSYRWNFQMMAAGGYIIVAPNRRGLYGFGQEWLEQISGDYGGQNMKDYLQAIDLMAQEPYVDADRLGAVGASYGGFSVYWLAGHHEGRFKAFIAHNGIFNLEQQYVETEEMWFTNWDLGGAPWDKANEVAQRTYANSPHKFVDRWDTPILCIHSELDYRIVASQGMAAFNAARLRGIPAEYLYFPDETHWVLRPQNGILWQRTFRAWLDQWLKDGQQ
ncbi:MAG: S9 family peptidase [Paludibacteraceae bacterium]|nr:S9 family peptidase [Paludibacteraceae bacterium]